MNTLCSNPVPQFPVNNGATIAHAPINTANTPPEHHSTTHGTPQVAIYQAPPLQRPEFYYQMSQASWRTTVANWGIYCEALRIPPSEVATKLYLCCDQQLQTTLLTKCLQLTASSGDSILEMIHDITCRDAIPAVFHRQFDNIIQQVGENIQNFAVLLEQMALDCEFCVTCTHCRQDTIYAESQQRDQLMQGLRDGYIRKVAYARAKLYPRLHDMVQFCAEMDQSANDMATIAGNPNTHSVDAVNMAKSDYVKQKLKAKQPKCDSTTSHATPNKTCRWCGKSGGNCYPCKTTCPTWNHTCEKCGHQGT